MIFKYQTHVLIKYIDPPLVSIMEPVTIVMAIKCYVVDVLLVHSYSK